MKLLPNLFTLVNAAAGCLALYFILDLDFETATYCVLVCCVFDFLDGFLARVLGVTSEFGKQLDSLADVISFGVVPGAVATLMLGVLDVDFPWFFIGFIITLASAYRLANYNTSDQNKAHFSGLPTPANALLWIGLTHIESEITFSLIVGAVIFSLASFSRGRHPNHVFGLKNRSRKYIVITTMIGMFVAYIAVFIGSVISSLLLSTREQKKENLQEIVQTLMANDDISLKIAIAVSAIIFAPLIEEVIFRGYIYPVIKRFSHPVFSCVITSLLFAVIHSNIEGLMPLFLLAIVLTIFYEVSKSIWVPILMHACFNGVNTISILLIKDAL